MTFPLSRYLEQSNLLLEKRNDSFKTSNEQSQAKLLQAEQEKVSEEQTPPCLQDVQAEQRSRPPGHRQSQGGSQVEARRGSRRVPPHQESPGGASQDEGGC